MIILEICHKADRDHRQLVFFSNLRCCAEGIIVTFSKEDKERTKKVVFKVDLADFAFFPLSHGFLVSLGGGLAFSSDSLN